MSGVGDKLTIGEARARRTDPFWRRRHKVADLEAAGLVVLLLVVPPVTAVVSPRLGLGLLLGLLVLGPAALWSGGPSVGFERRTALLVVVPVLNLVVLVPAVWRAAHLHLQRWQGPLEPRWDDGVWRVVAPAAVVVWLLSVGGLVLLLLS